MKKLTKKEKMIMERAFEDYSKYMSYWRMWRNCKENSTTEEEKNRCDKQQSVNFAIADSIVDFVAKYVLMDEDNNKQLEQEWFDRWYEESKNGGVR